MSIDVNDVISRVENQLGKFERDSDVKLKRVQKYLKEQTDHVRTCIGLMKASDDIMMLVNIAELLNDIETIIDKLKSIDVNPIKEVYLVEKDYDKIESSIL
jgi:hypothetical protein